MTALDAADLGEFVQEESHQAFARLAERYAGMVYAACLARLGSSQDAEDATQAVFLTLARSARSVRKPDQLACWLHGAAMRASAFVLRSRSRRTRYEEEAARMRTTSEECSGAEFDELRQHLGKAVEGLPRNLREVVMRHYFAGQTRAEIARELDLPEGTVASRVSAGLGRLRQRLVKSGVVLGVAALASLLGERAGASEAPISLLVSIPVLASGDTATLMATGAVSNNVAIIANKVLAEMKLTKLIYAACTCAAIALMGITISLAAGVSRGVGAGDSGRSAEAVVGHLASPDEYGRNAGGEQKSGAEVTVASSGLDLSLVVMYMPGEYQPRVDQEKTELLADLKEGDTPDDRWEKTPGRDYLTLRLTNRSKGEMHLSRLPWPPTWPSARVRAAPSWLSPANTNTKDG